MRSCDFCSQNAKAYQLSDADAEQRYVWVQGGLDENNREIRAMLGALPIAIGGKNRDPALDVTLVPGDVITLDRCPDEVFIILEMDALERTSAHRCVARTHASFLTVSCI